MRTGREAALQRIRTDLRTKARMHASGVLTAWTQATSAQSAVAALVGQIDPSLFGQLLVFFPPELDAEVLAREFDAAFPGLPVAGCSTAGEITPDGIAANTVVAMALPRSGFRV